MKIDTIFIIQEDAVGVCLRQNDFSFYGSCVSKYIRAKEMRGQKRLTCVNSNTINLTYEEKVQHVIDRLLTFNIDSPNDDFADVQNRLDGEYTGIFFDILAILLSNHKKLSSRIFSRYKELGTGEIMMLRAYGLPEYRKSKNGYVENEVKQKLLENIE